MVDDKFYILPLLSLLGQFERYAVLLFDRRNARLFNCYMGELKEEKSVFCNYEAPRFNKDINEGSFRVHLKTISKRTAENFKNFGFDKLILAGHKPEIESIKSYLPNNMHMVLTGEIQADIDDDINIIKEKVSKVVVECRRNKEKTKISELFNEDVHQEVIFGADVVLKALRTNNVNKLILADNFHTEGYSCPKGHFLTVTPTKGTKCDICGRVLRRRAFLEDEIIGKAIAQRVKILHLFYEKSILDGYEIAAFLRCKSKDEQEEIICYPILSWPDILYFG